MLSSDATVFLPVASIHRHLIHQPRIRPGEREREKERGRERGTRISALSRGWTRLGTRGSAPRPRRPQMNEAVDVDEDGWMETLHATTTTRLKRKALRPPSHAARHRDTKQSSFTPLLAPDEKGRFFSTSCSRDCLAVAVVIYCSSWVVKYPKRKSTQHTLLTRHYSMY